MNNIQLFDLHETNVSSHDDIKRYEDLFNCRLMLIGFDPAADNMRKQKFSNMDYPVLYENLKTQMLNKKVKMEKMKAKLKKRNSDYLDESNRSVSPQFQSRKRSFMKQNTSPLSALENTIQEHERTAFNSINNNSVIDSSDDSSNIFSDEEEGENFENLMASRSHRVSFNHSEEQFRTSVHSALEYNNNNETRRNYQQVEYSHQRYKSYNQFLDLNIDDSLFSIQLDFKSFQKSSTYNKYKAEIIKSSILKKKEPKYLIDNSKQILDKSIFIEKAFGELDMEKHPILENQSMDFNVLSVSRDNILENSASSLQKLQILQTDVFMFELKDCCDYKEESYYMNNEYNDESEKNSLDNILFELEQIITLIYETIDPSSQDIETTLMFCCCGCNNHVDNDSTISGGYIKNINPKLLKFFDDLGVNYKTNFFPISRVKNDIVYKAEEHDDLFNLMKSTEPKSPSQVHNNNYPALVRKKTNVSHVLATVSHDTGRLFVKSVEEALYDVGRKVITGKTDVLYRKSPKLEKKSEQTSIYGGSSSSISLRNSEGKQNPSTLNNDINDNNSTSNTQSSFFVSKDVRDSTNKSPLIYSPGFQNKILFNNEGNSVDDFIKQKSTSQTYTPVTDTLIAEENLPESHMMSIVNRNNDNSTSENLKENEKTQQKEILESDVDTNKIVSSFTNNKKPKSNKAKKDTCCILM